MKKIAYLSFTLFFVFLTQCKEPCDNVDCGPNGTCIFGECDCDPGWTGPNCAVSDNSGMDKTLRLQDSLRLVEFYNSLDGQNWDLTNDTLINVGNDWVAGVPINEWHGIEVNEIGQVVGIDLTDGDLNGQIPDLDFPELKVFILYENADLASRLPGLTGVPKLEIFNVHNCSEITGPIPDLTSLKNLRIFDCSSNNIEGSIPQLSSSTLIDFDCSRNQLTGVMPNLDNVPALINFDCGENQLSGPIPNLNNLPNLMRFYCANNRLSGSIPLLDNLPSLKEFFCSINQLTGVIPNLGNLSNLEIFTCNDNQLSGSIPNLENLRDLEIFFCNNNQLTGSIPELDNLTKLFLFFCNNNRISGTIPSLTNLNNLENSIQFNCANNALSGCYPQGACSIDNFISIENPLLPWQGDSMDFCNGVSQIGAPCVKNGVEGTIDAGCNCII